MTLQYLTGFHYNNLILLLSEQSECTLLSYQLRFLDIHASSVHNLDKFALRLCHQYLKIEFERKAREELAILRSYIYSTRVLHSKSMNFASSTNAIAIRAFTRMEECASVWIKRNLMRLLNESIILFTNIEEVAIHLHGAKLFAILDARNGFFGM